MTTTKQYDRLNRLKSISSIGGASSGSPILSSFDYQYNQANQRIQASLEDGSHWEYAYDLLGQVTSGKKLLANRAPEPDESFDYQHDDIGNRKEAGGQASARTSYAANALNQYTQRVDTQAPNKTETLQYDTDGNLIADGAWKYTWDAENRLVAMESGPSVSPEQRQRLEFSYDSQSRRISKKVYAWESVHSNFSLQPSAFSLFVYDGWNLLAELTSDLRPLTSFVWGLDLSGNSQGAGGVGGLLLIDNKRSGPGDSHTVAYDGHGNVIALVDSQTGKISAQYNHGPFGEQIKSTGSMAKSNPFRFSTKYTDDESDLVYYGYRYYNPETGKWISRDPIDSLIRKSISKTQVDKNKKGKYILDSYNPYLFNRNDGICNIDLLGLTVYLIEVQGDGWYSSLPLVRHRMIVGDDGTGGSYMTDYHPTGCVLYGPGEYRYWHFSTESAWQTTQYQQLNAGAQVTAYVATNQRVDTQLYQDAPTWHPFGEEPTFILGFQDCNNFAWGWMSWAQQLQDADDAIVWFP